jgi:exopolysaccharide biosynthesis WecB/TagA/CpsF family protein
MNNEQIYSSKTNIVYHATFIIDEVSIVLAFFSAIAIRFDNIINWVDFSYGIYASIFSTAVLFQLIVFFLYDRKKKSIVEMDPADGVVAVVKSRLFLMVLSMLYLFIIRRTALASRVVITLFFILSMVYGFFMRLAYRNIYIKKHGAPGSAKVYRFSLSDMDVEEAVRMDSDADHNCVVLINDDCGDSKLLKQVLGRLEKEKIRTYIELAHNGYEVRSGIVTDIEDYATIPAYVRSQRFDVFGIHYCIARIEEAVQHVINHIEELKGEYICFSNVHTSVMGKESSEYRDVLNSAAMVFPDGAPIARLGKRRGYHGLERVAGPDFMQKMFRDTMDGKVSHYFYGSTEETLTALKENLEKQYPGIDIRGMYSPPFRPLSPEEDEEDTRRINESGADILWVGLGAPKQEKWMNAHKGRINAVMMGVGAGFDFHAGTIDRAPVWIQKIGFEWLYRLFQDPGRLFKRYFVTNIKFFWYLLHK